EYLTALVKRGDLLISVSEVGTLQPLNKVEIKSEVSGRICKIYYREGDFVGKGKKLVELDKSLLLPKRDQALSSQEQTKIKMENEKKNLGRFEKLFQEGLIAQKEVDDLRTSYQVSQLNYKVAKSNLESIEEDLKKTEIYSPISGVIISADKEEGEAISGTNSAAQATTIMTVADLSQMVVEVSINEVDIGKLKLGQRARIVLDAFPEQRFKGKVISVAPSSEITEGIVTYLVKVKVDKPKSFLKPGMSAEAEISTAKREDVLLVPQSALREKDGKSYLQVKRGKGFNPVEVKVGLITEEFAEITTGVKEGEEILLGEKGLQPSIEQGGSIMPFGRMHRRRRR
ncbi:MAG: efflux RND transporter periplasmic adaptor subunit, partial [Candidatus Omnitrophica bacterium]|nr:efflux RND transporter periplasmic adaptor subunit [Candidatus Omnitrophota bacterium]